MLFRSNQGAWYQIRHRLQEPLKTRHTLSYAGRAASASPAAGYAQLHLQQQKALIQEALGAEAAGHQESAQQNTKSKAVSEQA